MIFQRSTSSCCVMNITASCCSHQQTSQCKWTWRRDFEHAAQFFWRPTQAVPEPTEAGVVTSKGRLLFARVGHQLESHRESSADVVSCAAWSDDGSMLAVATGNRIIIAAPEANDAIFRVAVRLPVSRPITSVAGIQFTAAYIAMQLPVWSSHACHNVTTLFMAEVKGTPCLTSDMTAACRSLRRLA